MPHDVSNDVVRHSSKAKDTSFDHWLATLRATGDMDDRQRTRWLTQQAFEESTLGGVLADLAEQGQPVSIRSSGSRRHTGIVRVVGSDYCALTTNTDTNMLVDYRAIRSIRSLPRADRISGDRAFTRQTPAPPTAAPQTTLRHALSELANIKARIAVRTHATDDVVSGELHSVGIDIMTIRLDGTGDWAYVPLAAVEEVSVVESG